MKGIILAGGNGTRLYPTTIVVNKHLLPIYDKPMIYYPSSVLMLAGITEILIISGPGHCDQFRALLGDGSKLGISISYAEQTKPRGLADAFILGKDFIGDDSVTLHLGDNIFFGNLLIDTIRRGIQENTGATTFAYRVSNPSQFGVVEFDSTGRAKSIEEKPQKPKSSWAVTGIYIYDNEVVKIAETVKPSARGEIEITSINNAYLEQGRLSVQKLSRGIAWLDTGTPADLQSAGQFIATIEQRQALRAGCPEEVALRQGYVSVTEFAGLLETMPKSDYRDYLAEQLAIFVEGA